MQRKGSGGVRPGEGKPFIESAYPYLASEGVARKILKHKQFAHSVMTAGYPFKTLVFGETVRKQGGNLYVVSTGCSRLEIAVCHKPTRTWFLVHDLAYEEIFKLISEGSRRRPMHWIGSLAELGLPGRMAKDMESGYGQEA